MVTAGGERGSVLAAALISLLGAALAVIHVRQALTYSGSPWQLAIDSLLPLAFALWILYGGYWIAQRGYRNRHSLYLLLWTVGGMIGVAGLGSLALLELAFHAVPIPEPVSVVTSIATVGATVGFLVGVYDVRSRRRTDLLASLQDAATALMTAEDRQAVADETVAIAREILEMDVAGVWLYEEETAELQPVALADGEHAGFGDPPIYREGNSLSWQVFEDGESMVVGDLAARPDRYNPETELRSELILPLGRQGVLNVGSTTSDAFDAIEISVAHILASTATSALERADREEQLRSQQEALRAQNERLEQFASVLSHDLRNPLAVAQGRLELLQEEVDSDHIPPIVDAHDRIDQMIEDLLLLAREGRAITETEPVDPAAVARDAWAVVEGDASLSIDCEGREFIADRARLQQLFENLFRNGIEHGGSEPTIRVGCVDDGFFVADDGPGIPEDEREQIFEFGYTGEDDGTGIGLAIVEEIAEGHGWSIGVTESRDGGARFDIRDVEFVDGDEA